MTDPNRDGQPATSDKPGKTPQSGPESVAKKPAAKAGVVPSAAVAPGVAGDAAPKGGTVTPVDSALVGQDDGKTPAAAKKPDAQAAKAGAAKSESKADPAGSPLPSVSRDAATGGLKDLREAPKPAPASGVTPPRDEKPLTLTQAEATAKPADKPLPKPAEKPAEPATTTPARTTYTPPAPIVRKTGFWPVVLGGVVAAALGSAATIWALPHLPAGWLPASPAVEAPQIDTAAIRDEAVVAARAEVTAQAEALTEKAQAAGAEAARAIIADMPKGADTTAEVQAALQAQAEQIAALQAAMAAPAAEGEAPAIAADALAALQGRIDEQAAQIAELAARPSLNPETAQRVMSLADQATALEEQIRATAQQAQQTITEAEAQAQQLQQAAAESTRRAEAVAAIATLQSALDQGAGTAEAVDGLKAAGVEPPAEVTPEVATLAQLQESYDAAAREGLRAALKADTSDDGAVSAIGNFLRAQTGARSVAPQEGTDPDAILSRAGAAVDAGDIAGALAEIATLPEPARAAPAMADWIARAQGHVAAHAALDDLAGATPAPTN